MVAADRLKKQIDSLQLIVDRHCKVADKVADETSAAIQQQLQTLRSAIANPRLVINIVSQSEGQPVGQFVDQHLPSVEALVAQFSGDRDLLQHYQINSGVLNTQITKATPEGNFKATTCPILKLHAAPAAKNTPIQNIAAQNATESDYTLVPDAQQAIGRNPAAAQIVLSDGLTLVSGAHAQVQFANGAWQIQDLGSRNGTFINGSPQKLQGWHRLQAGDRISLGAPEGTPTDTPTVSQTSALFTYEERHTPPTAVPPTVAAQGHHPPNEMAETIDIEAALQCNVLCIVVSPSSPLPEDVRSLIEKAKQAQHIAEVVAPVMTETQMIEIRSLASDRTEKATEIEPFCRSLCALAKKRFDRLFASRVKVQMASLAHTLEQRLAGQKLAVQSSLEQLNSSSDSGLPPDFKEAARDAQRKVSGEKDWFFRQVKNELMQSKTDVLNDFKNSSVTNKVSQFISKMTTQATNRKGFCYVRLYAPDGQPNVHEQTMALINRELTHWIEHEWEKVAITYVNRGYEGLIAQSKATLAIAPALVLPSSLFPSLQTINPTHGLQGSLVAHDTQSRYPKQNIFSYLLKNLRGQLFGIVGLMSILGGGFGIISGGRNTLMLIAAPVVIVLLCFAFQKERKANQEKEEEKLKKEALAYYQSIAKDIAERQLKSLASALELEDRKFKEALEEVSKVYARFAGKAEQAKKQRDAQQKAYSTQLIVLEKDCAVLQRLQASR